MKNTTKLLLTLALVATTASSAPVSSYALNREASRVEHATRVGGPTAQRWWGALAGTICRFGSGLYNPYGGYCIIALLDAMTS